MSLSAEALLAAVDAAPGGVIEDSRTLAPVQPLPQSEVLACVRASTSAAQDKQDLADEDAAHKAAAQWQLSLHGTLLSLQSKEMITFESTEEHPLYLTLDGRETVRLGAPEARLWALLPEDASQGVPLGTLQGALGADTLKQAQARAFRNKLARRLPDGALARAEGVATFSDDTRAELLTIAETGRLGDDKKLAELKKRKMVAQRKLLAFRIAKGPQFARTIQKLETDLTAELLASGAWKTAAFKKYNLDAAGVVPPSGALHPLLKVRAEFRKIFFEMGFAEMPTNRFVDSSFWCFDSLFVPQQHPARDVQDTFFVADPPAAQEIPEEYLARVVEAHERGAFGSIGYRYPFDRRVTESLVLRTHTTAVSSAMLYQIANQPGGFRPAKLFSIDRVFRNEATDMTHLAEFHQVEGVVADYGLTLGDLIGFMQIFFTKMGVKRLRFKPAYNPYTEPSLEIFSYHDGLRKWVEIGNSGMFRPEMIRTMGIPEGVNVLGFGLSLERPTMIRYGIRDIRHLVGHKVPLDAVEHAPAVRF
ncbi:phenylalanine--tRNA ligase [Malassezia furfur]|uniref:phenylalanine--tRNA ligase n=1 Tax=Malassezia furfur TaxID=55194 RepID=A0ABY8EWW5_MALFU|nr:FRS2 [Malassezia furfur]WFD49896.1 phenylalanine--tRNA ligase [Malassezia furfur]